MNFRDVYAMYQPDLSAVESLLHESVQSNNASLTESARQLIDAGGKRIRPLLALVCSRLGGADSRQAYPLAAALELIHMATLVHDDVIDDAALRRGSPTVRSKFGNRVAMFTGDFLFARAILLLNRLNRTDVHREMAGVIVRICEGEIDQISDFYNWRQSFRTYLRRVERKTALLIASSCATGAAVGNATQTVVTEARRFGYYTGLAFQMIDDVLDYIGEEAVIGKPVGGDLRQGNITLPALRAARHEGPGTELKRLVHRDTDHGSIDKAVGIVVASDGLPYTKYVAKRFMEKAEQALTYLDSESIRQQLTVIADFVNNRAY